jgi:hypothetical protein
MSDTFEPPTDLLGADLFWWRETGGLHTLVSLYWKEYAHLDGVILRFVLFDEGGRPVARWQAEPVEDQLFLIDSTQPPSAVAAADPVGDGVLAVYVSAPGGGQRDAYDRLYGLVDWYSDAGSICGLHSDQVLLQAPYLNRFTEIVVEETPDATATWWCSTVRTSSRPGPSRSS